MKALTVVACLLTAVAATNPFLNARGEANCECDTSKCPPSGEKRCECISGLLDACYVAQTQAGADCGAPVYPDGCESQGNGKNPIKDQACTSKSDDNCASDEMCFFPDKSCLPRDKTCTGLCASDFCGGRWEKECPDDRWVCEYDDECQRSGGTDCEGKCVLA